MDTRDPVEEEVQEIPASRRGWRRGFLLALFAVGLVLGGVATAAMKSRSGQRYVLDLVLSRTRGSLAGSLTVDSIRSGNLLGGAVLVGVRLDAAGGRRFLEADSASVRYSLLSLLGAPPRIASVTLFGPRVEISRYPGEEAMNVARLVAPREAVDSAVPPPRGARLGRLTVIGGRVELLTPMAGPPSPRIPSVPAPGGDGLLRRVGLEGIDLQLTGVRLGGREDLFSAVLDGLSMDVAVLDRPLVVQDLQGQVRFGAEGLVLSEGTLRTPGSILGAGLTLGPREGGGAWSLQVALQTQGPASLGDLLWLDDRLPQGVFRGGIDVAVGEALDVGLRQVRVELEASRLAVDGGIHVDGGMSLRNFTAEATPLALSRLEPWIGMDLGLDGWLSGRVTLSGTLASLATDGRVTLVPTGFGGRPTTADVRGTLHLGTDLGFTNVRAVLDPLSYDVLAALDPAVRLSGDGRVDLQISGRMSEALRFVADVSQGAGSLLTTRVLARGSTRRNDDGAWVLDVQGDLSPLSLTSLGELAPALALAGTVSGSVRAVGPLRDLHLTGEFAAAQGRFGLDGTVDATDFGRTYRLDTTAEGVRLSDFFATLPEPSIWSGRLKLEGRGVRADSVEATGSVTAFRSRVGGLAVDTLVASVRTSQGVLRVDTVQAVLGGVEVEGSGELGMTSDARGTAHVAFRSEDIFGLRPLFMGDSVVAGDTLSVLERASLRFEGVDIESLPDSAEVAMSGVLTGDLTFTGGLSALDVTGTLALRDGVYGRDHAGSLDVRLDARTVTTSDRVVRLSLDARDVAAYQRDFPFVAADLLLEGRRGEGSVAIERPGGDRYSANGAFALDSDGGGDLRVDAAVIALDSMEWHLARPSEVLWDTASVTFRDLEVIREGVDPMSITATGTLSSAGSSNLRIRADGLHLDRLARVAEWEELGLGGHLDMELDVSGPAGAPVIDGSLFLDKPRYKDLALSQITANLKYEEREAVIELQARDSVAPDSMRLVFRASGTVPVDLALNLEGRRVVQRQMDVHVTADSLDAAVAFSSLSFLEDVQGLVSGDFRIRGTLDRPEPSGVMNLDGAAWTVEALEVRHGGVSGSLTLNPDRTVDVTLDGRAGGTSSVRGRVVLDPLSNPRLDLTIGFQGFQAVDRRDITGLMTGEVMLAGSYRAPRVEGNLTVDRGTIFLDEFVRSATVVDLTDPRIFDVVDTTALSTRPLLAGIRNPFFDNLRVDVDLSVPRDSWLRSEEMNVEMGGSLFMRYDRVRRDVVMVGELQALRGSYSVLGRRFDVESGTIGFIGTPGINPSLDIQAVSRIRRVEGDPLDVTATVAGTLTQPRVTLSSAEQGVAESDLVSYLIFGRPSYELANNQQALVGAAAGAGVTFLSGTLATRLGAALSQRIGLDYLSITQAGNFGVASISGNPLAGTQVEVGQYLTDNVFFILVFRPKPEPGSGQSFFGGARMEVALNDDYNVQGFWEDRFLQSGFSGLGQIVPNSQIVGVFIFREWGY
ncbi:MAG TPA: translocation/assembly module TamB domain-containing protein [Longimicrobiales bacterium]|nr:translocation/assembly module TamB domain-containing protein [Longimicrobiales bacterium]